jgi:hypothetical protein
MSQHDADTTMQLSVSLQDDRDVFEDDLGLANEVAVPSMWGIPLKYIS